MKKYLKSYTAITTGSMAGRDDGYPYTTYTVYEDIETVAKYHGTKRDEEYFEINAVNKEDFEKQIEQAKQEIQAKKEAKEREEKLIQLQKLKEELGEA